MKCAECDKLAAPDDYLCQDCRDNAFPVIRSARDKVGRILDLAVQANKDQPSYVAVFAHQDENSPWVTMRIGILELTQFPRTSTVEIKLEYAIWIETGAVYEVKYGEAGDDPIHPSVYEKCFKIEDPWASVPHSSGLGNWDFDG